MATDIDTVLADKLLEVAGSIVGTRVYPAGVPQSADLPWVLYQRISGAPINSSDGPAGGWQARYQINCDATTYKAAHALAALVRGTGEGLSGWTLHTGGVRISSCLLLDERDDVEEPVGDSEDRVFRVIQDYSIRWR